MLTIEDEAYDYCTKNKLNPSPALILRKFKICGEAGSKLSDKVKIRIKRHNHLEARKLAMEIESN